jgi:uncharacterized RDD family membrane protein YckC
MNDALEHRCVRCGRRLHFSSAQSAPDTYPLSSALAGPVSRSGAATATARAFETYPGGAPMLAPEEIVQPDPQPSLFRETSNSPKVIPIPTLTPLRPSVREGQTVTRRVSPRPGSSRPSPSRPRPNSQTFSQQALDLQEAPAPVMAIHPGSEMHGELIFCDAPVAHPTHRMLAAAVDFSIVATSLALFLGVYAVLTIAVGNTSDIVIDRQTMLYVGGITAVFSLFYRMLFVLANGDTPGMRFAGLKLVDFDGRRPNREQRFIRQIAAILSLAACGLGLFWALVDEESLTWHDHISKTFPTAI